MERAWHTLIDPSKGVVVIIIVLLLFFTEEALEEEIPVVTLPLLGEKEISVQGVGC